MKIEGAKKKQERKEMWKNNKGKDNEKENRSRKIG
jgi:hypothetical protein